MYCRVLALDFDGTSTTDGNLCPAIAAAACAARARGITVLLVTGRVCEELRALCPDLSFVDAVVAENGAVIWFPALDRTIQLGAAPPQAVLGELRSRHVSFHAGDVVVGTSAFHAGDVLDMVRCFALDSQLVFNRGSVMLLPSGVNKAAGIRRALAELGRSEHNLIAFGDAENDLPMFAAAELAVTVRGASEAVVARADACTTQRDGAGVAEFILRLLRLDGRAPTPDRRRVVLGRCADGAPVHLPASGTNVMLIGDPHSGKSWLAGLLAEQLLEQEYLLCIIDPEGEYLPLSRRPRTLLLGGSVALPEPTGVSDLLASEPISLVLSLAGRSVEGQRHWVATTLPLLQRQSAATGVPHWTLIDEAHCFFPRGGSAECGSLDGPMNFVFATYRPSLVSSAVHDAIGAYLITSTTMEEERYFLTTMLQAKGPRDLSPSQVLEQLEARHAGLLTLGPNGSRWQVFTPGRRLTGHAHHARKYADGHLPEEQAFRFLHNGTVLAVARNLRDFHRGIRSVSIESLRHHLLSGDFSRWSAYVVGDEQLSRGLRRIESTVRCGATINRGEILAEIESEYRI